MSRPRKVKHEDHVKIRNLRRDGWSYERIASFLGISSKTVQRSLKKKLSLKPKTDK